MKKLLAALAVVAMMSAGPAFATDGGDASSRSGVRDSGNSSNRNLNAQGQMQGQVGIVSGGDQRNVLRDSGNSEAYGGNVYIGGGDGEGQGGGRTLSPSQRQSIDGNNSSVGAISINMPDELARDLSTTVLDSRDLSTEVQDIDVDASEVNTITYEGDEAQKRNPVSSAWAAPLVTSNDTCMGSTSAGGQGITLGLSFATTWTDDDCIIRKDARFLHNAQHATVALGLMCEKPAVRRAVARAGSVEERRNCGLNDDGSEPVAEVKATDASDYDID